MVSALEFLEKNPDILERESLAQKCELEVFTQASRHTQRNDYDSLFYDARPTEEDHFREWRLSNKRDITGEIPAMFHSMLSHSFQLSHRGNSFKDFIELDKLLKESPFTFLGQELSIQEYIYKCIFPYSDMDSNAVLVEMVESSIDPSIPPIQFDVDSPINIRTELIPFFKKIHLDNDIFMWEGGYRDIGTEKIPNIQKFYYIMDKDAYWTYEPRKVKEEVLWFPEPYYTHSANKLLISGVAGRLAKKTTFDHESGTSETAEYKETYCQYAFAWLDEVVTSFSSDQVNRIRTLNAVTVINGDMACPTCNGSQKAKAPSYFGGASHEIKCPDCVGGTPSSIGQWSTVKVRGGHHNGDKVINDPVKFVTPDVAIFKQGMEAWQVFLNKAKESLCLNILEGVNDMSGVAMALKQAPKAQLIKQVGDDLVSIQENILNNKLCLLARGEVKDKIKLSRPINYEYKGAEQLLLEYKESTPAERPEKFLKYIRSEHMGSPLQIKCYELAICYAPLMLIDDQVELKNTLDSLAFNELDLIKSKYAKKAFDYILSNQGESELSDKEYFDLADQYLRDLGVLPEPVIEISPPI